MKKLLIEAPLFNWLQTNNIKGVLFDLDDTIIKTNEIFMAAVQEVVALYVKALPQLSSDEVSKLFREINISVHGRYSVNPKRWEHVIAEFEAEAGVKRSIARTALHRLAMIYKTHPEYEKDAEKLLLLLKKWRVMVGLVTHANAQWTLFKLESLGLADFFNHVAVVSEDKLHKNSDDWLRAADDIQVRPKNLLGVGDNMQGDVQSAVTAGFGKVAWVDKKNGWDHYRTGERPSGVLVVEAAGDLLELKFKK